MERDKERNRNSEPVEHGRATVTGENGVRHASLGPRLRKHRPHPITDLPSGRKRKCSLSAWPASSKDVSRSSVRQYIAFIRIDLITGHTGHPCHVSN